MEKNSKPVCFVIMPFRVREDDLPKYHNDSGHWNEVYEGLIVPAINEAGMQPQRDDDDYTTRLITEGIWSKIEEADLVTEMKEVKHYYQKGIQARDGIEK